MNYNQYVYENDSEYLLENSTVPNTSSERNINACREAFLNSLQCTRRQDNVYVPAHETRSNPTESLNKGCSNSEDFGAALNKPGTSQTDDNVERRASKNQTTNVNSTTTMGMDRFIQVHGLPSAGHGENIGTYVLYHNFIKKDLMFPESESSPSTNVPGQTPLIPVCKHSQSPKQGSVHLKEEAKPKSRANKGRGRPKNTEGQAHEARPQDEVQDAEPPQDEVQDAEPPQDDANTDEAKIDSKRNGNGLAPINIRAEGHATVKLNFTFNN